MLQTSHIIWNVINFLVLLAILYKLLAKPVQSAVQNKQDSIKNNLADIETRLKNVTDKVEDQEDQLIDVINEVEKIREQSTNMAEKLKEEIVKSAHSEAEKLKEQLKKSMDQDLNRTRSELKKEVIDKALFKAQEIVSNKLDSEAQKRLIKGFAVSLGDKPGNN